MRAPDEASERAWEEREKRESMGGERGEREHGRRERRERPWEEREERETMGGERGERPWEERGERPW